MSRETAAKVALLPAAFAGLTVGILSRDVFAGLSSYMSVYLFMWWLWEALQ